MSDDKYKKRGGTTDLGKSYEDYYLAFTVLKLLQDENVEDFRISTNDGRFGAFDDLVLETKYKNKSKEKYAIQLKHKEKKDLTISNLKTKNFSILKYYESFQECCYLLSDYKIILFTNAKFTTNNNIFVDLGDDKQSVKIRITECVPFLAINTSDGKSYQFQLDSKNSEDVKQKYKDFFERFFLYTNQMNVQRLKQKLANFFGTLFSESSVTDKFLKFISEWNLIDGTKDKLTKDMMIKVITLRNVEGFIYPHNFCEVNEGKKIVQKAISNFNITAFESESLEEVVRIWGNAKSLLRSYDIKKIKELLRQFQIGTKYITDLEHLTNEESTKLLWVMDKCPMIMKDHPAAYETAKLCGEKSKFVFITDRLDEEKLNNLTIFKGLLDLKKYEFAYNDILKYLTFTLFGEETNLDNLIKDDGSLENLITTDEIVKMTNKDLFRLEDEKLCFPYIGRHLNKITVNAKYFQTVKESTMILISNVNDEKKLRQQFQNSKIIAFNETISLDVGLKQNILIFKTTETSREEFKSLSEKSKKYKECHHFRYHDEYLEWIESIGDVSDLQNFCNKNKSFIEDEKMTSEKIRNSLNIVIGDPGIGKSIFMKKLKNNLLSKNYFAVMIQPIDVPELCRFIKRSENLQKFFNFITESKFSNFRNFEKHVLKLLMEKGKAIFLWDALDELSEQNRITVEKLIGTLSKNSVAQFLTSRAFLGQQLERTFQVLCKELQPFNDPEQTNYIQKRLQDICCSEELKSITTAIKRNIADTSYRDILGIPLQIHMLTELLRQDLAKYKTMFTELFVITDLYSHFIKEKFNFYFKIKRGFPESYNEEKCIKRYLESKMKYYQQTAVTLLFGPTFNVEPNTELQKFMEETKNEGDEFGLITAVDLNMQPEFLHKSYAEYFTAIYLAENCRNVPNLENVIFKKKYANVRYFFDTLLGRNSPVHIAVLCKNLKYLQNCENEDEFKQKDFQGRNALHLAASWGKMYPLLKSSVSGDQSETFGTTITLSRNINFETEEESLVYYQIIDTLLKNCDAYEKDQLFNLTPIMYAEKCNCLFGAALIGKSQENENYLNTKNEKFVYSLLYYAIKYGFNEIVDLFENIKFTVIERRNSLLHMAVERNQLQYLNKLLKEEVYRNNINYGNRFCETALLIAARKGYLEIVKYLIQENANVNAMDNHGWTSLHRASFRGHHEVVKYLIQENANVNATSRLCQTPLHLAAGGHFKIVKYLIQENANVNVVDINGWTPLHSAAHSGQLETVQYLIQENASVNETSNNGKTPIHLAVANGHLEIVKCLIEENANVNAFDNNYGCTPLHLAAENGQFEMVTFLIQNGADINATTSNGTTILWSAAFGGLLETVLYLTEHDLNVDAADGYGSTPVMAAAKKGHFDVVEYLLTEQKSDINAFDINGFTPLHWASEEGHHSIVELLIASGAKIDVDDKYHETPLTKACAKGHDAVVQLLIKRGANVNSDEVSNKNVIDGNKNWSSKKPLHMACANGHKKIVEILLDAGADYKILTTGGQTCMDLAIQNKHDEIAQFLHTFNKESS